MKRMPTAMVCGIALTFVSSAWAAGHYEMVWFRQWDRSENGQSGGCGVSAAHVLQVWVFNELGQRMGNVHLLDHNGVDHGWYTNPNGERCEIPLFQQFDRGVQCVDAEGSTSDVSPVVSVAFGECFPYYSYDVGFVFKAHAESLGEADSTLCGILPDRTNGSDDNVYTRSMVYTHQYCPSMPHAPAWALRESSGSAHAQTFVADGVNRILGVFLFPVQPANGSTKWRATIREGGPDGPPVCSKSTPVDYYFAQPLAFAHDQCPCVPGGTYTVTLEPVEPATCNVYLYPGSNYAQGGYTFEGEPDPARDMFGFVWAWDGGVGLYGILRGVVTNTDGRRLSGVTVDLSDAVTGTPLGSTLTNLEGRFMFPTLTAGSYRLDFQKADHKPATSTGHALQPDRYTTADQVLLSAYAKADFNRDNDVDLTDFSTFQTCYNGPNLPPSSTCGTDADFDNDGDVDLADFAGFQACFNGPNRTPAAQCPLY